MTPLDPGDPVVKLCVAGVQAEQAGDGERAAELYTQAWDARTTDLEASIAAHYLARVQPDPESRLRWNMTALEHADTAGESARSFLPSLHLNVAHSHEALGDLPLAAEHYEAAAASLDHLPDARLADSLRGAVRRALDRIGVSGPTRT